MNPSEARTLSHIAREGQSLYLYSMGKALRITAIFTNVEDANRRSASSDDAVIAELGPFIFMANKYDQGIAR